MQVILGGKRTRGSLSIGWLDRNENRKNLMMVCGINRDFVNKIVVDALDSEWIYEKYSYLAKIGI